MFHPCCMYGWIIVGTHVSNPVLTMCVCIDEHVIDVVYLDYHGSTEIYTEIKSPQGGGRHLKSTGRHSRFLNLMATEAFLKIDMRHGYLRDKREGYFLNLKCDIAPKIVSDIRQGYFPLVTGAHSFLSDSDM